jgi:hypothetical protein
MEVSGQLHAPATLFPGKEPLILILDGKDQEVRKERKGFVGTSPSRNILVHKKLLKVSRVTSFDL